jgi:hypothetical protein
MRKLISMVALSLAAVAPSAQSAEEKKPTAQQEKMTACNKDVADKMLAGDERQKFVSTCLKG